MIAHRGAACVAPENTIPAIQAAIDAGFEWVEVDVRKSKDNVHVLSHDHDLKRTTNSAGPVAEKTWKEIKSLDAGSWFAPRFAKIAMPALKELFSFCKDKINIYLDCKDVDPASIDPRNPGSEDGTAGGNFCFAGTS